MSGFAEKVLNLQIRKTRESLKNRNFESFLCENTQELITLLDTLIPDESKVTHGGSMTLEESGVYEYLRHRNIEFYDREDKSKGSDHIPFCMAQAFVSDTYIMSTSAITTQGELYNIDGTGNRLAAMMYGPKQVLIIVGTNKIVRDLEEARNRVKNISAPANAMRLQRNSGCTLSGSCQDCRSKDRICSHEVITSWQTNPNRIKIIILKGEWGY